MYLCYTSRDQKKALATFELELWMVVSYHVGTRNRTWVLWKIIDYFLMLNHLSPAPASTCYIASCKPFDLAVSFNTTKEAVSLTALY